jgi:hypothetical protein
VSPPPDGRWPLDGTPVHRLEGFGASRPALDARDPDHPDAGAGRARAYVQKLGTDRGAWREVFEPQTVGVSG